MPQGPGPRREPPPVGTVFITSMSRPDAALALAAYYVFDNQRASRAGAVCVEGSGFGAAVYCDLVEQFYRPGNRNSNSALPVGFADADDPANDPAMLRTALERRDDSGEPAYARTVTRVADTAHAPSLIRNGITFNAETVVVLSAPATSLSAALDIANARERYGNRVHRLVLVETPELYADRDALARICAEWPTPIVFCGAEVGESLSLSSTAVKAALDWASPHPIVDALNAYSSTPYEFASGELAGLYHAIRPETDIFELSPPGRLELDNVVIHSSGDGNARRLSVASGRADEAIEALVAVAGAEPERRSRRPF